MPSTETRFTSSGSSGNSVKPILAVMHSRSRSVCSCVGKLSVRYSRAAAHNRSLAGSCSSASGATVALCPFRSFGAPMSPRHGTRLASYCPNQVRQGVASKRRPHPGTCRAQTDARNRPKDVSLTFGQYAVPLDVSWSSSGSGGHTSTGVLTSATSSRKTKMTDGQTPNVRNGWALALWWT